MAETLFIILSSFTTVFHYRQAMKRIMQTFKVFVSHFDYDASKDRTRSSLEQDGYRLFWTYFFPIHKSLDVSFD